MTPRPLMLRRKRLPRLSTTSKVGARPSPQHDYPVRTARYPSCPCLHLRPCLLLRLCLFAPGPRHPCSTRTHSLCHSCAFNPSPVHCDDTSVQGRGDCRRMQLLCVLLLAWARARAPIPVSDGPSGGSTRLPLARGGERGALPAAVALLFDAPTIRRDPAVGPRSRAYTALFSVMMMFHFTHLDAIKGLSQRSIITTC